MSNTLVTSNFPVPSAVGSLDAYVNVVHQIPMLTQEEEQALAHRFIDLGYTISRPPRDGCAIC